LRAGGSSGVNGMRQRSQTGVLRLADALKAIGPAATFVFLLSVSLIVLVLGRVDPASVERVRTALIDAVSPVLEALSRPIELVRRMDEAVESHLDLKAENERLKDELERLRAWQAVARTLYDENKGLRSVMNLPADPQTTFVTARVVADAGGPFVRTVLIGAGERDGLQRGQAITTADGIVGRIVGVGVRASRVLLLTDLNSRVPVRIQGTKLHAILVGDNGPHPKLDFLPSVANIAPGDRVVTSGDGGMFPAGLPVGTVIAVEGRTPRVQLTAELQKLEFVRVLKYAMPLAIDDIGPSVIAQPGPTPAQAQSATPPTTAPSSSLRDLTTQTKPAPTAAQARPATAQEPAVAQPVPTDETDADPPDRPE